MTRLPILDGVRASRVQLQGVGGHGLVDALCGRFPDIARATWLDRMARGRVLADDGARLDADSPCRDGMIVHYWREVPPEPVIATSESIVFADARLLVVDKPHGLPVTPSGGAVTETLLARLLRRFDAPDLSPLHRIDRDTAGLVMFSRDRGTRAHYHALFERHAIHKTYEAIAGPLPSLAFPHVRRSRLERGEPFFRTHEVAGDANSETRVEVIERGARQWRYALHPVTGRKHQLRVHLAALGAPILHDPLYPALSDEVGGELQLLARALAFVDPIDATPRHFVSERRLLPLDRDQ